MELTTNPAPRPQPRRKTVLLSVSIDRQALVRLEKRRVTLGKMKKDYYGELLEQCSACHSGADTIYPVV